MNKVLYIEDNALNMRLVKKHLQRVGITMLEASTGITGIDLAIDEKPDLVLVDINLPDIDGLEVTRRLKAYHSTANLPIVALTANAMHGDRELCLNAGCDAYLAKPVARLELYNTLRVYMPKAFIARV
ncbi:MAG: response regulator [Anaerolineae bacterium]